MNRVKSFALASAVALSLATGMAAVLAPATGIAAEESANKITTKAVAVALKKAQELMQAKQWEPALAEIKKAQAVEKKTPFEAYQIDEFLAYVLIQQKKYSEAAAVYERQLNSGFVPEDQRDDRMKTLAQLSFQVKDYKKAAEWSKKSLERRPNQQDMGQLLAQSYYLLEDYPNAAAAMQKVVQQVERAGRKPEENWLQIILSSHFKANNRDGVADALKQIVRYYPTAEYWENLLDIYRRKTNDDRVLLGYYRLMDDVGALKEKGDFVEMAQLALDAGVPGEAEAVVERGIQKGVLKSDDKVEQGRYDRLLSGAKKQASADKASLAQLAQEAEKASQGQALVALGHAYLSYDRYDEAIAALEKGIKKGGVLDVDEAQILLGIAYLKKGQKEQARQAFKAVKEGSKWNDLSSLWIIRTHA
jgi:tetratricopeptide (TPR) repeat protein